MRVNITDYLVSSLKCRPCCPPCWVPHTEISDVFLAVNCHLSECVQKS